MLAEDLETLAISISRRTSQIPIRPIGHYVDDVMETAREQQGEAVTGIPTGLDALDEVTQGWQDGDLI